MNWNKKKKSTKPKVINYERVKNYMLWMISKYGDYSTKTLIRKANVLFKENTAFNKQALDYLVERDIINDARYAKRLTLSYSEKNIGVNKIKEKLYLKGFNTPLVNECIDTLESSDEDYFDKALILKIKRFGNEPIADIKIKQKALRHLITKGFPYSIANKAITHEPI